MSRMSVRTARSETYFHTYEANPSCKPSPVPPFVVVHNTASTAFVKVTPRGNDLPEDFIDEDQGSTTSSVLSWRSWSRLAMIVVSSGVVVLAAVTVAAGLLKAKQDRSNSKNGISAPSLAPQPNVPTSNGVFSTAEPSSSVWVDDEVILGENGIVKVPYEETQSPDFVQETRPPRTHSPTTEEEIPWNNYVIGLLAVESPDTFTDLDDTTSSQYKALKWLSLEMSSTGDDGIAYNQDSSLQKFGLLCLWYATGGDFWTDNSEWTEFGTSECTWKGVTCDSTYVVIALDLKENALSGSIPPEIKLVRYLQSLTLSGNAIGGNLPVALAEMSELVDLQLSGNELAGPVPPEYGSLDMLTTFDVSSNALTGTIPSSIGNMGNLEVLNLCSNDFSGNIPPSIGSLTYLRSLNLGRNAALEGVVPDDVCDLGAALTRNAVPDMVVDCSVKCECCLQCCASTDEGTEAGCCSA
ncbi:MAG: hypothetical protein SGILL_007015 [Bacillariaceae sp.]